MALREKLRRHGLKIKNRIRVPKKRRNAVTAGAPITGNRLFANDAPLCIDSIEGSKRSTG